MSKYTKYDLKDFGLRVVNFIGMVVSAVICVGSFVIAMIDGLTFVICTIPGFVNIGGAIVFEKWDFFWGILRFFGIMGVIFLVFASLAAFFKIACKVLFERFVNGY